MRRALLAIGAIMVVSGCASSPRETVLSLDTTDPRWKSRKCVAVRRDVFVYDDQKGPRRVVRTLGNVAFPLAGSAVALGMSGLKDDERKALNARITAACVTPPKAKATQAAASKKSRTSADVAKR